MKDEGVISIDARAASRRAVKEVVGEAVKRVFVWPIEEPPARVQRVNGDGLVEYLARDESLFGAEWGWGLNSGKAFIFKAHSKAEAFAERCGGIDEGVYARVIGADGNREIGGPGKVTL